ENNLRRIGGLDLPKVSPILGSENEYFYRNKMEFSFSDSRWLNQEEIESGVDIGDRNALGFHIPGMWDKILDIEKCHLQQDPSNALRLEVKRFAVEHGLDFYKPKSQEWLLRTLMIRTSSTGEIMVLIQFLKEDVEKREALLGQLQDNIPETHSLLYLQNLRVN